MGDPDELRKLPAVDRVVETLAADAPRSSLVGAARAAIDLARARVRSGSPAPSFEEIVDGARNLLELQDRSLLRPVLNATGVLLHTNLGRAPLGEEQVEAIVGVARSYSNLEYDLTRGARGSRYAHAGRTIAALTGAEEALVVNNNAAAVLLVLAALCSDKEVVISRGELIEIGGEFRIPDVMALSGARLVEVGTTNRTHLADYERAITPDTAAILKVHPSNYRVVGFVENVSARELARLARGRGVSFFHDLGSGLVQDVADLPWASGEPLVDVAVAEGADLVTFSGDKLFGGPQAGVIAGRRNYVEAIRKHPLLRALRVDKLTLAGIQATTAAYLAGRATELPLWRMALASVEELRHRAERVVARLDSPSPAKIEAVASTATMGGGSMPDSELASWAVSCSHPEMTPSEIGRALLRADPPVIARVEAHRVLLDLRTVPPEQDETLAASLRRAI